MRCGRSHLGLVWCGCRMAGRELQTSGRSESHHHSLKEDGFTARLVEELKIKGVDVWVDTHHGSTTTVRPLMCGI